MHEADITQTHGAFSLACCVQIKISASASVVWALLTMPDLGPVFERYADDLKRAAERAASRS